MPDIIELANQFRDVALRNERGAASRLIAAYDQISARLLKQISALNQQIAEARAKGEIVSEGWLYRQKRYGDLLRQVDEQMKRFAQIADSTITRQQRQAGRQGLADSARLMEKAALDAGIGATFNKLPAAAIENMVGFLGDGSPLKSLLDELPRDGRQIVAKGLVEAVALGWNPAKTAREIREGLDFNRMRALMISRTETLRAYRTASHQNYKANADIVRGWTWRSARSSRSCAACIALDGTFHPVSEPQKFHVRCRCTMIPSVRGVEVDRGVNWFERQDEKMQREIIGTNAGFEAFKAGKLKLEDFVGLEQNPRWGDSYHQLSVKRALAGEGRFPGDAARPPEPAPPPAEKPKKQAKPKPFPDSIEGLETVKPLGGSTGATLMRDPATGKQFVLKRGSSAEHLREEFTADQAYQALGINVPKAKLYETATGPVKLAEFIEGKPLKSLTGEARAKAEEELRKHFAADALLGNWDVIGLGEDNILLGKKGKVYRIDNGGALRFRAQGARKTADEWNQYPSELWSLRERGVNRQTAKVFGGLNIYDIGDQIETIAKKRTKLIKSLPEDLKETVKSRLEQLQYIGKTAKTFKEDKWVADYTDGFTKHVIGIRKDGIVARMPNSLKQAGSSVTPKDENGLRFDHLRGAGSLISDLAEYMRRSGTNHEIISRFASDQAGNSWNNIPAAIKAFWVKQREADSSSYWWKTSFESATERYAKAVEKLGEDRIKAAWQIQHAFHFELLNKVDLRYNDRKKKLLRLIRTENIQVMQFNQLTPGANRLLLRGAHESASLYKAVFPFGTETTVQYVPHYRITSSYLLERSPGSGDSMFMGDGENEFVFLPEGISFEYLGYRKNP